MIPNALYWADCIRRVFIQDIDALAKCLEGRILPAFASLDKEAEQLEKNEFERRTSSANPDMDPAEIAETSRDLAVSHYQIMRDVEQAALNLFAAACFHLLEQQLLLFHRKELLSDEEKNHHNLLKISEVISRLAAHGIDLTHFSVWPEINDLRLVANVVKHADGKSADQLRSRNPDLFARPDPTVSTVCGNRTIMKPAVYQPLMGRDFFVTIEAFRSYARAVRSFWQELAAALVGQWSSNSPEESPITQSLATECRPFRHVWTLTEP